MDIIVFDSNYRYIYQFTIEVYVCEDIESIIIIDNF